MTVRMASHLCPLVLIYRAPACKAQLDRALKLWAHRERVRHKLWPISSNRRSQRCYLV
jgi:hypothetical protein